MHLNPTSKLGYLSFKDDIAPRIRRNRYCEILECTFSYSL